MPVIGRLDDQVEAVLINPLERRSTTQKAEREQTSIPAPDPEEHNVTDTTSEKREAEPSALPVWLL